MSPLEKVAGGMQAGRFLGSALTQAVASIPTAITKGSKAAEDYIAENVYKPNQPKGLEYAQDVGDFLEGLETEYKLPAVATGDVLGFSPLIQAGASQAARQVPKAAMRGAQALERRLDPMVTQALERGGLQRDLLTGLAQGSRSNVIKPKGGNWLSGGEKQQIRTPEGDLSRLRAKVGYSLEPEKQLKKLTERYTPEALAALTPDIRVGVERAINETRDAVAINKWIDGNLTNYVKKEMATPDDPVRRLAEEGIIHTPLRDTEAAGDFLRAQRAAEGFPAEGMGRSELARRWEDTADDSIRVTKAGAIQDQENTGAKLEKARAELEAYKEKINEDFIALLKDKGGLSDKDRATFDKFPFFQMGRS